MEPGWRRAISQFPFPDPLKAGPEGLLAAGGDLSPMRLISAYSRGIFPWFSEEDPILWWSPDPRMLLMPPAMKVSKSLASKIRAGNYSITFDKAFEEVIRYCASVPRKDGQGTWILNEMIEAYSELHQMGYAHSVETWMDGRLAGGLYGVSLGLAFFGESMFHLRSDASKLAFYELTVQLKARGYCFLDCQMPTSHLASLGAEEVPRAGFLGHLQHAIQKEGPSGSWSSWSQP